MALSLADPRTLVIALLAEIGLAVVGAVICWLVGIPLLEQLAPPLGWWVAAMQGVAAAAPMVVLFFVLLRLRWRPLAQLRRLVQQLVRELLDGAGLGAVLVVSVAAGIGEEVLFRGALQPAFGLWLGPWAGVGAAALLFGLAHPMSYSYFVIATLCGVYLGVTTVLADNLIPAIVAHAVYDFVALWWLSPVGSRNSSTR